MQFKPQDSGRCKDTNKSMQSIKFSGATLCVQNHSLEADWAFLDQGCLLGAAQQALAFLQHQHMTTNK